MNSNDILFWIKNSVSIAGDNIEGTCFLRLIDDIKQANVQLIFIAFEYSKILHKRQIPYDANNPQMIPEKLLEKKKEIQISQESPKIKGENNNNNQKKKYELKNGTLFQITRQYGVNDDYSYIQDLYSGTIKRGDYTFPFQIPTRFSMNSSFIFKNTNGLQQAKIGYKLYLKVQDTDSHQIILQKGTPIYINSRHKICEESRESEGNIVQFCCIHRGMIELGIRIQKNVFKPGEMIELEYILNTTRAQRDITRVEIRFKHFLSFTDNDETERIIINTTLFSNILPGIVAGKRSEILKSSILIPSDLQATIKTKFIRNHYLLEIEAYALGLLTSLAIPVICQIPVIILERKKQIKPNTLDWKVNSHSQDNNQFYCFTLSQQKLFN